MEQKISKLEEVLQGVKNKSTDEISNMIDNAYVESCQIDQKVEVVAEGIGLIDKQMDVLSDEKRRLRLELTRLRHESKQNSNKINILKNAFWKVKGS